MNSVLVSGGAGLYIGILSAVPEEDEAALVFGVVNKLPEPLAETRCVPSLEEEA